MPVILFQGLFLPHNILLVPEPHVSLSSSHLYHQKQGEPSYQEAGNSDSCYVPDIFHVTLENHITLIILSVKMVIHKDHMYMCTWIRDSFSYRICSFICLLSFMN